METKPRLMPLLPLRGMLVFPGMIINLDVGRERSIHAVEAAMTSDKQILLVSQKEAVTMEPGQKDLFKYGVIAETIIEIAKWSFADTCRRISPSQSRNYYRSSGCRYIFPG